MWLSEKHLEYKMYISFLATAFILYVFHSCKNLVNKTFQCQIWRKSSQHFSSSYMQTGAKLIATAQGCKHT
jgi:hypothetical protein